MKKFIALFASISSAASIALAFASPDYNSLATRLYPENLEDSAFIAKFFEIVEAHKTNDPFLGGKGPSVSEYRLDRLKFAFITNEKEHSVDLVFFNWDLALFEGLEEAQDLSDLYGKKVYVLKNLSKKTIATQGEKHDQLTSFSYVQGANFIEKQLKLSASGNYEIPKSVLEWKPHPDYMDRSHPLRQGLDTNTLVILSPSKELLYKQFGLQDQFRNYFEKSMEAEGGFYNAIMGMMVHEMYHAKDGDDRTNGLSIGRNIQEDRKAIIEQLKNDADLRSLIATYVKIIFSIGDSLKLNPSSVEATQLSELKLVISEMKSKYIEAWKYIWNFEYSEGFAEYVSAFSMIQVGITSLDRQIDLQKSDKANGFVYRTGAIGGLYLAKRLEVMPFKNQEDHFESVWEIIIRLSQKQDNQTQNSQTNLADLKAKYSTVNGFDEENEIARIVEYLISTVTDIE